MRVAVEQRKTLVIHCRDAAEELMACMREHLPVDHPTHVHCFTGDAETAERLLAGWSNLCIGFTGHITYEKASSRATAKAVADVVPIGRLLLETDGPFMMPQRFGAASGGGGGGGGGGERGRRRRRGRGKKSGSTSGQDRKGAAKRVTLPEDVLDVAIAVAHLKGVSANEVLAATTENARRVYQLGGPA